MVLDGFLCHQHRHAGHDRRRGLGLSAAGAAATGETARYPVEFCAVDGAGHARVDGVAVLPDHRARTVAHHGGFVGAAVGRDGRALRIRRSRGVPGSDAQPVPDRTGLRRGPSRRGAGMRLGACSAECRGRPVGCLCDRRNLRPFLAGFCRGHRGPAASPVKALVAAAGDGGGCPAGGCSVQCAFADRFQPDHGQGYGRFSR